MYNNEIELLNAGYVRYIDHMGDDLSAVKAARMSTNNPTGVDDKKDDRLRNYLWSHQHTSPTEMAELVVEMQLPIFVLRQIDRHRTLDYPNDELVVESVDEVPRKYMSRNEFSGRYSEMEMKFYIPEVGRVRGQHSVNKQGSGSELSETDQVTFISHLCSVSEHAKEMYKQSIELGVARELARALLPVNFYTRIQLKGSLLSWFKFLALRDKPDVQWETRQYARAISSIIKDLWPKSYTVFEENTLTGVRLSGREKKQLWQLLTGEVSAPGLKNLFIKKLQPWEN